MPPAAASRKVPTVARARRRGDRQRAAISLRSRSISGRCQPVTALVYVAAPVPLPVNVTIASLDPSTVAMQADILASLQDAFLAIGEIAGTIYPSQLYAAISATPGVVRFDINAPADPVTAPAGALPVMGTLTVI